MPDDSKLSESQKRVARGIKNWELFSVHTNGDVTLKAGEKYYRISKDGVIVSRPSKESLSKSGIPYSWIKKEPSKPSLSEELTASIKPQGKEPIQPRPFKEFLVISKPIKVEKKTEYIPYSYKTICQDKPECCQPREIKGVFWDADHTIWDLMGTAASVTGKLKKTDDNTVVELSEHYGTQNYEEELGYELTKTEKELLKGLSKGEKDFLMTELEKEHGIARKEKPETKEHVRTTIKLDPTFRQTLDELEKKGIPSSIISLNTPGSVKRILKEFGLDNRFTEIRDSYENKGKVFRELTHKQGVCACNGLFIDDSRSNTDPVADNCGMALQIGKGKDIEKTIDVLKFIKENR